MPHVQAGEHSLNYSVFPSEQIDPALPTAIFLHGFTLDRRMWDGQRPLVDVDGTKRNLIFLDALGHGRSDAPETGYSRAHRIADTLNVIDALALKQVHLVGHSMGGATGIGFAIRYPERLFSLTLICSGAAGWQIGKWVDHVYDLAKKEGDNIAKQNWITNSLKFFSTPGLEAVRVQMAAMMNDHSGAFWRDPMRGHYPAVQPDIELVGQITVPTLILIGEYDKKFVPLAKALNERIVGSRLHIYENCGHMLPMEQPVRCNRDLAEFFAETERKITSRGV